MRFAVAVVVVALGAQARADGTVEAGRVELRYRGESQGALLELDPMFDPIARPNIEGLGAVETRHSTQYSLLGFDILVDGVERRTEIDLESRGFRAGVRLSRDLGPFRLTAGVYRENTQSRFLQGTSRSYTERAIAITKTFKLSRWNTAWVSLSLASRKWDGIKPPEGEQDSTQLMLSVGTTFK